MSIEYLCNMESYPAFFCHCGLR